MQTRRSQLYQEPSNLRLQPSSLQFQPFLRALDTAVVHLTGAETIGGNKSFSIVPTVGTRNALDNSTRAASTAYADSAVSTLSGNL
jgi:hypothetical protein